MLFVYFQVHNLLHMWPGRPDDGESVHSGDGSNTDSGRGASEEGENAHKLDAHQAGVQGRSPRPDPQGPHQGVPIRGQAGGRDPSHPGYYVAPHRPPSSHSYSSNPPRLHTFSGGERGPGNDSVVHATPARIVPVTSRSSTNPRQHGPIPRPPPAVGTTHSVHGSPSSSGTANATPTTSSHTLTFPSRTSQLPPLDTANLPPPYKSVVVWNATVLSWQSGVKGVKCVHGGLRLCTISEFSRKHHCEWWTVSNVLPHHCFLFLPTRFLEMSALTSSIIKTIRLLNSPIKCVYFVHISYSVCNL